MHQAKVVRKIGCECKHLEKAFKYAFDAETLLSGFITNPISS